MKYSFDFNDFQSLDPFSKKKDILILPFVPAYWNTKVGQKLARTFRINDFVRNVEQSLHRGLKIRTSRRGRFFPSPSQLLYVSFSPATISIMECPSCPLRSSWLASRRTNERLALASSSVIGCQNGRAWRKNGAGRGHYPQTVRNVGQVHSTREIHTSYYRREWTEQVHFIFPLPALFYYVTRVRITERDHSKRKKLFKIRARLFSRE